MHLLVPFAADDSEACRHVLHDLALPNLERLLALLTPDARDDGDADTLSPPHERALAAAWGWQGGDGLLPFAAHAAAADGIETGAGALGAADAEPLAARPRRRDDARPGAARARRDRVACALRERRRAVRERGRSKSPGAARSAGTRPATICEGVATASLDRVIGRSVDRWLRPRDGAQLPVARLLRRLQSEVQIVLPRPRGQRASARSAASWSSTRSG